MPDPIQVETLFQEVMAHFESSLSIRHRYRLFRDFIESLEGSFKKYESYILQLVDELPVYSGPLSWSGINPEQIERDLSLLNSLDSALDLSKNSENYQKIRHRLGEVCLLLWGCLNEKRGVKNYINILFGFSGFDMPDTSNEMEMLDEIAKFVARESRKQGVGGDQGNRVDALIQEIKEIKRPEKWKVLVPVAEVYNREPSEVEEYGRLRKISVERYSEKKEEDELVWNMKVYGAVNPSIDEKKDLLIASRNLFESTVKKMKGRYYRGGVSFEFSSAVHEGDSANLAISALWYTRLLEAEGGREIYEVRHDTAITGDVDKDGKVLPIDEKTIGLKTEAAFFSWARVLVVPAQQRQAFQEKLEELQATYPQRKLGLIGAGHLSEIFYDRRVSVHNIQGRFKYYFSRIRNEQPRIALIPLIVVLLLIIARLGYGPLDRNPVIIEYEGSEIVLKNSAGATVERLEVGQITADHQNTGGNFSRRPLHILADLDKDGINELIYANRVLRRTPGEPFIRAWSVSGDSLLWDKKIISDYTFPRQSAPMNFSLRSIEIAPLHTEAGLKIAINASVIQYFQSVIFTLDAITGEIEQQYVHPGRFDDMYVQDLNDDGEDEIILVGINNAYWDAVIAVLEYGNADGYAPATIDYIPSDTKPAKEFRYILLPKTLIGKYFESMQKYNRGKAVNLDELSGNMFFRIQEGRRELHGHSEDIYLLFYFDVNLKPLGIGTSDMFDIVARELHEKGEIPFEPRYDYFEALQDSILYWNGNGFVTTPEFFQEQ